MVWIVTLLQWKVCNFFPDVSGEIFSWKLAYKEPRCIQKTSPTKKYVTSSLACPELRRSSKSLECFTYRVGKLMAGCVSRRFFFKWGCPKAKHNFIRSWHCWIIIFDASDDKIPTYNSHFYSKQSGNYKLEF